MDFVDSESGESSSEITLSAQILYSDTNCGLMKFAVSCLKKDKPNQIFELYLVAFFNLKKQLAGLVSKHRIYPTYFRQ